MELGAKLRQARLEAGLSQRQLCGEEITRNMLSQIENGTAKPSMKTLQFLAARLEKPVSFFLEESAVVSPNQALMETARQQYDAGDYSQAVQTLQQYREPDCVYDREKQLLWVLSHLALAEKAVEENRKLYALELLQKAEIQTAYCSAELLRRRLLLLGRIQDVQVSRYLPSLDPELRLRAEEALLAGKTERAANLLEAIENQKEPDWNLLRGQIYLARKQYKLAAQCFHNAESTYPGETAGKLELCYRELKDYKRAYEYACKQKR